MYLRSCKVRIYPNETQKETINKSIGSARFMYNQTLAERKEVYEKLKNDKQALKEYKYKSEKEYKQEYEWLSEASSRALQQARLDLQTAFKNFYGNIKKGKKGRQVGFPKFKKKSKCKWSYREPQTNQGKAIEIKSNKLKLNKLGWVKFRGLNEKYRDKEIRNVTIELSKDGKYYASILFSLEREPKKLRTGNDITGIDLGLKEFVTTSKGETIKGIRETVKTIGRKINKANKNLSRKTYGSNRYEKQRKRLNRLYKKKKNVQNHFFWHLANKICGESQSISIESLHISGMKKNRKLSRAIHEVSWYDFTVKLQNKATEYGTDVLIADRFYPSSKTCSACGQVKENLLLSERVYKCDCGYEQDRDVNAALNLRNYYIMLNDISSEYGDYGRGENVRPVQVNYDLSGNFVETSTENLGIS